MISTRRHERIVRELKDDFDDSQRRLADRITELIEEKERIEATLEAERHNDQEELETIYQQRRETIGRLESQRDEARKEITKMANQFRQFTWDLSKTYCTIECNFFQEYGRTYHKFIVRFQPLLNRPGHQGHWARSSYNPADKEIVKQLDREKRILSNIGLKIGLADWVWETETGTYKRTFSDDSFYSIAESIKKANAELQEILNDVVKTANREEILEINENPAP